MDDASGHCSEVSESVPPRIAGPRSPILAIWSALTGILTAFVGLGLIGLGMGFANATAAGTGGAAVLVGLWTLFAVRGIARRRPATFLGLGLAWVWLFGRIAVDFPATAISIITALFLAPQVVVPLVVLWVSSVFICGIVGLTRGWGIWRRSREPAMGSVAESPRPKRFGGLAIRLGLLVALTLLIPPAVWAGRGSEIASLADEYRGQGVDQPVAFGACSLVFLGYELTRHGAENLKPDQDPRPIYERTLACAEADLESIASAGAKYVRVGVSGDHLLNGHPDQEALDDRYMAAVRRTGIPVVFVDTQHPQALPRERRKMDWPSFCQFHRRRIEYYQRRYHPAVYVVVCEPLSYHYFFVEAEFSADAWADELSAACRLVKSIDPKTRTAICLLVMDDREPEWEVWSRMQRLPELDILSVEIYEPKNFHQTQERLRKYGHPGQTGKSFWIAETYNGWALAGDRRWDQDAAWLRMARDFARTTDAETVLVWTFGTFVPGGSFWDFIRGNLHDRWEASGGNLSVVGQAFAELAGERLAQ